MQPIKYTMWEEPNGWRGYLKSHPDQVVQGKSFDDLQLKLRHLNQDLIGQSRRQELLPPQAQSRAT
ncbi:MAG: type II toxin-antitoxin system HicB family antitoxin [Nitrospira sp.]|nr:type II toxin-antitoxin system HicB family antitoxin [Nitrospira sp.]